MYSKDVNTVLMDYKTSAKTGLGAKEAVNRLSEYGYNELPHGKKESIFHKFVMQLKDFMIYTLVVAAAISFGVSYMEGEPDYVQPAIILFIIIMNGAIGVIQEVRAEHSLNALKKMCALKARVLRNGKWYEINSRELVPGDIINIEAGDFVPADARIIESKSLMIDESSLTGESEAVLKCKEKLGVHIPLNDRNNMIYSGCIASYGHGRAVVTATGKNTELGKLASLLMDEKAPQTPLQKKLGETGKILSIIALIICGIIFVAGIIDGREPAFMFMTAVSLAVAAIPEGLPAIVTIMLARGVIDMARQNGIIRRLPAVETLGCTTIICSDKTGTLTCNKMEVTGVYDYAGKVSFAENGSKYGFILKLFALCNNSPDGMTGEPTENALYKAAEKIMNVDRLKKEYRRIDELPFTSERKMMSVLCDDGSGRLMITKGAPDFLLEKCTHFLSENEEIPLDAGRKRAIRALIEEKASEGKRLIVAAYRYVSQTKLPDETGLVFAGIASLMDPPRKEVKKAVALCKRAGIKTVMITGDHVLTAGKIARDLNISKQGDEIVTGVMLDAMSDEDLKKNIGRYNVFARVSPAHKLRIVKAYRENGEVVAMTGDGVNDAPALKAADIGCAMGITGTDVAKDASDIILEDDNFVTITQAIKQGRIIYDNIRKAVHFLISCNIGEILTIFAAILMGYGAPLDPVQLLWINLVTDSLPALSLGVEPGDENIMGRKPVSAKAGIFSGGMGLKTILEGMMIGSISLAAYMAGAGKGHETGETMCFAVLALSQLIHAINSKSEYSVLGRRMFQNKMMNISFVVCAFLQVITIAFPFMRNIMGTTALDMREWGMVVLFSIIPLFVVEAQKRLNNRK